MKNKISALFLVVALIVPLGLGLFVRLNDVPVWERHKALFFFHNRPLFTSYDAYYFAYYAKSYSSGTYKPGGKDPLTFVPDGSRFPKLIPMESWLGAQLTKLTGASLEEVALWMSPIFGVLFTVPFVLFFFRQRLWLTGLAGATLGVLSLLYLARTSIVRFDTDSLNLFFPFLIALFNLLAVESKGFRETLLWIAAAGVAANLYYWWYQHPGLVLASLIPLLLLLPFKKELSLKEKAVAAVAAVAAFNPFVLALSIPSFSSKFYSYVITYVGLKNSKEAFPNVLKTISEARHFQLYVTANITAGSLWLFIVGLAGTALLTIREFKRFILVLPFLLVGCLVFISGNRFAMYLAPFVGAGLGYFFDVGLQRFKSWRLISLAVAPVLVAAIAYANADSFKYLARPKIPPQVVAELYALRKDTPQGSWIWTWWDLGTAIKYYGERGVYHDGQSQFSPKTYFIALSFVEPSLKAAYNVTLGISRLGEKGIKKLLKEGVKPDRLKRELEEGKFNGPVGHPVYWLFTQDLLGKFYWISYLGTWDFKKEKGINLPLKGYLCVEVRPGLLECRGNVLLDLNKGIVAVKGRRLQLGSLGIRNAYGEVVKKSFPTPSKLSADVIYDPLKPQVAVCFLMPQRAFESAFNRLFILREPNPYFKLVRDRFPFGVLYRVKTPG